MKVVSSFPPVTKLSKKKEEKMPVAFCYPLKKFLDQEFELLSFKNRATNLPEKQLISLVSNDEFTAFNVEGTRDTFGRIDS
jgi:hypothetical protein